MSAMFCIVTRRKPLIRGDGTITLRVILWKYVMKVEFFGTSPGLYTRKDFQTTLTEICVECVL